MNKFYAVLWSLNMEILRYFNESLRNVQKWMPYYLPQASKQQIVHLSYNANIKIEVSNWEQEHN